MTIIEPATPAAEAAVEADSTVSCASCGHDVTDSKWSVSRSGSGQHRFRNPAGWSFQVVCFKEAPGCAERGEPTTDASWFPGYAWHYAHCGSCGVHLGWVFTGSADAFYGLIATRLV